MGKRRQRGEGRGGHRTTAPQGHIASGARTSGIELSRLWRLIVVPATSLLLSAGCAQQKPSPPKVTTTGATAHDTTVGATPARTEPPPPTMPPPPPRTDQPVGRPPIVPRPAAASNPVGMRELFPHVRADLAAKVVEFDGTVPINCHDPDTPEVFLEVTACTPDTKEHETLVVTSARPSNVHAALLAIGLKPGKPGAWKWEDKKLIPIPPSGDPVEVTIAYRDAMGHEIESPASDWVRMAASGQPFRPKASGPRWVFAGSVFATRNGEEVYDADGAGTLIGLTTFGSEVIAWADTLSPESSMQDPDWIADPTRVPKVGTPVVVRIKADRSARP